MTNRLLIEIAQALIEVAKAERALPEVMQSLRQLEEAFKKDSSLLLDLAETSIPLEQRKDAVEKGLGAHIHPYIKQSLKLLIEKRQALEFQTFTEEVLRKATQLANHHEVVVTSVTELSDKEKTEISTALEEKWKGTVQLTTRIDPTILGGLKLTSENWSLDASLRGRIDRLKHTLAS